MLLENNTLGPYLNSVVVALGSTFLAVLIGSLAAYALVRIRFQVKLAAVAIFLLLLVAVIVAVATLRRAVAARASASRSRSSSSRSFTLGRPHPARGRQQRHRVLDHLEPHHAADRRGAADLRDVPAARACSTPDRADRHLHRGQPADRGLADPRLLRRHPASTSRRAPSSTAPRSSASSSPSRCRWSAPASSPPSCWC